CARPPTRALGITGGAIARADDLQDGTALERRIGEERHRPLAAGRPRQLVPEELPVVPRRPETAARALRSETQQLVAVVPVGPRTCLAADGRIRGAGEDDGVELRGIGPAAGAPGEFPSID